VVWERRGISTHRSTCARDRNTSETAGSIPAVYTPTGKIRMFFFYLYRGVTLLRRFSPKRRVAGLRISEVHIRRSEATIVLAKRRSREHQHGVVRKAPVHGFRQSSCALALRPRFCAPSAISQVFGFLLRVVAAQHKCRHHGKGLIRTDGPHTSWRVAPLWASHASLAVSAQCFSAKRPSGSSRSMFPLSG
jgi:hypothetical protein